MSKFTKAERQYIKGIVSNYALQRWTDQDIVDYLHTEKKIDITRPMINVIRNAAEREAEGWYIELKNSRYKLISFYKTRLDSLLLYQKKLNDILMNDGRSEIVVRAIAELHRIEMSLFELFKQFPEFQMSANNNNDNAKMYGNCNCSTTSMDSRSHSECRSCLSIWCHSTFNQDWCPNPDCSQGIKGNHFKPFDEYYNWVECSDCKQWFKKQEILQVHSCRMQAVKMNVQAINNECNNDIPNIPTNVIIENSNDKPDISDIQDNIKPEIEAVKIIASEHKIEPKIEQESAADLYWQLDKYRPHPRTRIPQQ